MAKKPSNNTVSVIPTSVATVNDKLTAMMKAKATATVVSGKTVVPVTLATRELLFTKAMELGNRVITSKGTAYWQFPKVDGKYKHSSCYILLNACEKAGKVDLGLATDAMWHAVAKELGYTIK